MTTQVTCLRCGSEFQPIIEETQLEDTANAVMSVKCPKCGKLNPATDIL